MDGESGTDVPPEKRRTGGTRCLVPRRKASYLATALQHGLDVPAFLRAQSEDDDRIPAGRAYAVGVRCGAVAMEDVPEPLQDAIRRLAPSSDPAR
ncbi:MAG: hypothetical protein K6E40_16565 [Desulfovibrio sp.]|nr:hypothetical protein [Desulfovibrio sp.]